MSEPERPKTEEGSRRGRRHWTERLRGWTRAQKISAAVLVATSGLVLFIALRGGAGAGSDGAPWSPAGSAEAPAAAGPLMPLSAELGAPDWTLSPGDRRSREEDRRRRMVEESILFNRKIARVRFMFHRREAGVLSADRERITSAAVVLDLKPGIERLSSPEARSIRQSVAGAYGVEPQSIQIVDGSGQRYGPASRAEESLDTEERIRHRIHEVVEGLYLGLFYSWEFRVAVMVDVSSRESEETSVSFDREKSVSLPVVEQIERGESDGARIQIIEEDSFPGSTTRTTRTPAGEILAVRVSVVLDLAAVQRVLRARYRLSDDQTLPGTVDFEQRVASYEQDQEDLLANLIPRPQTQIEVSTQVFAAASPPPAAPATPAALAFAGEAEAWEAVVYCLAGAGGLLAFWFAISRFLARRARRRKPADQPGAPSSRGIEASLSGTERLVGCEETLDRTRHAMRVAKERPEVAASILRLWLSETETPDGEIEEVVTTRSPSGSLVAIEPEAGE